MSHWDECESCKASGERPGVVHVYGQESWHEEAFIVADEKGLHALREAIDRALAAGHEVVTVAPADGEMFSLHVVRRGTDSMDRLTLPYSRWEREVGAERRGRYPSSLVPHDAHDEVLGDDEWFEAQRKLGDEHEK